MITQEVNVIALAQAAEIVVGQEQASAIAKLYRVIDDAMFAGYELGREDAQAGVEEKINAAFDNGYENGQLDGLAQGHGDGQVEGFDDGYLEGVGDARSNPARADLNVAAIIATQFNEDDAFDSFDDDWWQGDTCYCDICVACRQDENPND